MVKTWIGIDPGATGAIAILQEDGAAMIEDWPGDERALTTILRYACILHGMPEMVLIEYQQAMPKQGVVSMFKLGVNYGMWLSAVAAVNWPVRIIRPNEWKKGLGYPARSDGDTKEYSLTLARRLYPKAAKYLIRKKDHNRAEALLLAHVAKEGYGK